MEIRNKSNILQMKSSVDIFADVEKTDSWPILRKYVNIYIQW
jgi:hypothetical protein